MYKACRNQKERIKANLVQYKATLIMRKIHGKYTTNQLILDYTAKIIRVQIRYLNRTWRKSNMKIVSIPYQLTQAPNDDDWLQYEGTPEDAAYHKGMMSEEEIRALNSDFNFRNYGQFYESEVENTQGVTKTVASIRGLYYIEKEPTQKAKMLQKLWDKVQIDTEKFKNEYEDWLEDEVWSYFD